MGERMKSLAELERVDVREAFINEALEMTCQMVGVSTAEKGFGDNDGVFDASGSSKSVDDWFNNAAW